MPTPVPRCPAVAVATEADLVLQSSAANGSFPPTSSSTGTSRPPWKTTSCSSKSGCHPVPPAAGWAFDEIVQRHGDFALVGVAAMLALDQDRRIHEARVCLIGVADHAVRAPAVEASLVGQAPTVDAFTAAAADAVQGPVAGIRHARIGGVPPTPRRRRGSRRADHRRRTGRRSIDRAKRSRSSSTASNAGRMPKCG